MAVKQTIAKLTNLQGSQHIGERGRWNSLRWKHVLVYDCEGQTLSVQQEKKISKDQCYKLYLPKHDHVTIFLDLEAGSEPTTARISAGGVSNKELAKLDLASLGIIPRWFCSRSTLYVTNVALEKGETSSEIMGT
ncbi:hypothetical protein JMJ35_001962 [Cladonia borealis]|uniref:Uncharacterized protein n=1 Tax=Cladonia borealis TaxID=184061 RepID=A0AA39R6V6_9LECA|nr:hypothetical protein JMJ35_001962 [Cladonia borealis]